MLPHFHQNGYQGTSEWQQGLEGAIEEELVGWSINLYSCHGHQYGGASKIYNMTHICKDVTMKPIALHAAVNI